MAASPGAMTPLVSWGIALFEYAGGGAGAADRLRRPSRRSRVRQEVFRPDHAGGVLALRDGPCTSPSLDCRRPGLCLWASPIFRSSTAPSPRVPESTTMLFGKLLPRGQFLRTDSTSTARHHRRIALLPSDGPELRRPRSAREVRRRGGRGRAPPTGHRRGQPPAAQDLHHADRPRADPRPDQRDGRRARPAAGRHRDHGAGTTCAPSPTRCCAWAIWRPSVRARRSTRCSLLPKSATGASPRRPIKTCEEIDRLESDADRVMRRRCRACSARRTDVRELIKLKAIYEQPESITDRCEDVANLIEASSSRTPEAGRAHIHHGNGIQVAFWVVVLLVVLALLFDFMNGFHDAANSIATVVSTGVLKPQQAVLFAAFFNFVAIFIFQLKVAHRRQGHRRAGHRRPPRGLRRADRAIVEHRHLVLRHPSSSSHALIGGIVGASDRQGRARPLIGRGRAQDGGLHLRLAAAGLRARPLLMVAVAWLFRRNARRSRVDNWFRRLQLVSAGCTAWATAATTRRRPSASSGCC